MRLENLALRSGLCALLVLGPQTAERAGAQATTEGQATIEELERRVRELERIVALQQEALQKLSGQPSPAVTEVTPAPPPAPPAAPPTPTPSPTSSYFNPSVAVIGNFLAVGGHSPVEDLPVAEMRESELSLQAVVDPYARADFFLSFGEEGVDLEEGFATFTTLPWHLLAKVGRVRTSFGKINTLHLHALPWPDEPLHITNLLGGEEGWIGTGVSVARMIGLPKDTFSELMVEVQRGDEDLFLATERDDLAYSARYRVFRDLGEATNLDVGLSYGNGPNGSASRTELQGIDATLRWKPLRTASYRSLTFRGEHFWSERDEPVGRQDARGWFVSGDYQMAKRWFLGARLEASDRAADADATDRGEALLLTFWPSEFSQLRSEIRRRELAEGGKADEVLLQLQFSIGAHGAHPF